MFLELTYLKLILTFLLVEKYFRIVIIYNINNGKMELEKELMVKINKKGNDVVWTVLNLILWK